MLAPVPTVLAIGWLTAGAVLGAPVVWLLLGLPVAIGAARRRRSSAAERRVRDEQALRRQLAIARRAGERASVVLAEAVGADRVADLPATLRVSDFSVLDARRDGSARVLLLLDGSDCDRSAFEQRLRQRLGGHWSFSWACFPDDGPTLDALVEHAAAARRQHPERESIKERN